MKKWLNISILKHLHCFSQVSGLSCVHREDNTLVQTQTRFNHMQQLKTHTNLLDLIFLHEGHELEEETRQAEQEIDELVYN